MMENTILDLVFTLILLAPISYYSYHGLKGLKRKGKDVEVSEKSSTRTKRQKGDDMSLSSHRSSQKVSQKRSCAKLRGTSYLVDNELRELMYYRSLYGFHSNRKESQRPRAIYTRSFPSHLHRGYGTPESRQYKNRLRNGCKLKEKLQEEAESEEDEEDYDVEETKDQESIMESDDEEESGISQICSESEGYESSKHEDIENEITNIDNGLSFPAIYGSEDEVYCEVGMIEPPRARYPHLTYRYPSLLESEDLPRFRYHEKDFDATKELMRTDVTLDLFD